MSSPSLEFLCKCIVTALLDFYKVAEPPVPIREILSSPPPDLARDVGLTEALPFGDALWLRMMRGQGQVFVNPALSSAEQRYAMARALFTGLCSSMGGQAAGLPAVPNDKLNAQSALFARHLLMPAELLPSDWPWLPPHTLAELFLVPVSVAEARLHELGAE